MYKRIFCLALCYMYVSSNGTDQHHCQDSCETLMLSASLGSSVLLQCNFGDTIQSPFPDRDWVLWVHADAFLVNLTSRGWVQFLDPRHGRVKAYPNQGLVGNFPIRIDDLQESDLGCYQCGQGDRCHQVEVVEHQYVNLVVYVIVGVTTFILLVCACSGYAYLRGNRLSYETHRGDTQRGEEQNREENNGNVPAACNEDHLPRHPDGPPGDLHNLSRGQQSDTVSKGVRGHQQLARLESSGRRQRLHRELLSKLQQTSRPIYANQDEINQEAMCGPTEHRRKASFLKKKAKQRYENPIYNRSTDQLHYL